MTAQVVETAAVIYAINRGMCSQVDLPVPVYIVLIRLDVFTMSSLTRQPHINVFLQVETCSSKIFTQYVLSSEHGNFSEVGISNNKQKVPFGWRNTGQGVKCFSVKKTKKA